MERSLIPTSLKSLRLYLIILGAVFACTDLFFLYFIDRFHTVPLDLLDGRLILAIHEHWFQVFSGKVPWDTMPQFWPLKGTLGFSDTFFLTSIPYAFARALGANLYVSFIFMLLSSALLGYFSFYYLLRRCLRLSVFPAVFLAVLFINTSLTHNAIAQSHPQLLYFWFLPLFLLTLVHSFQSHHLSTWFSAGFSGIWFALLFFSAFYIPWFFAFFALLFLALTACLFPVAFLFKSQALLHLYAHFWPALKCPQFYLKLAVAFTCFALTLIPFFQLYLPVHNLYGNRDWNHLFLMIPSPQVFFNLGTYNWMWSGFIDTFHLIPQEASFERSMGWGPFLFTLFTGSAFYLFTQNPNPRNSPHYLLFRLLFLSLFICLLLNFKFGEFTLWKYVYQSIPGASVVRYMHRFNFALILPILVSIGFCLTQIKWSPAKRLFASGLCLLTFLEQQPSRLCDYQMTYADATARFQHIDPPPPDALTFSILRSSPSEYWPYTQLDALFIAQKYHLHTVNGYSGIDPKNWWLFEPSKSGYAQEVLRWIHLNDAQPSGLYQLDWDSGQWSQSTP